MKKVHFLLWALMALFCFAVSRVNAQVIKYPGYTSYYNPKTLIPDSVIWTCSPHKKVAGRDAGFHATGGRPNLSSDYLHSGYDIGHNCDASDENGNAIDEHNSFDFCNTFPQTPNDNRLVWLGIENYTRALNKPVRVKVYWIGIKSHIGKDNVTVPLYCVKELRYGGRFEKYVVPNNDTVSRHLFTYYRVK